MRHYWIRTSCVLVMVCLAGVVHAEVPQLMSFQGRLTDVSGNPVDTTADLTFTIYADPGGTTTLWTETHANVPIEQGVFSVSLGQFTSFGPAVFSGQTRYLGFQLAGGSLSDPLVPIVSGAYSLRSARCDTADYAFSSPGGGSGSGWTDDGTTVRLTNTNDSVGIGTGDPRAPLEAQGAGHAIIGESHGSGTAAGVFGGNDTDGFGVMGVSNDGRGVTGLSVTGFGGHFYGAKNYFNQNLGIGTEAPAEMLHVYTNSSGASSFIKLQSDHPSNWGETGLRFQTPQNTWHLRMDDDANMQVPTGGLGLRSQSGGEVMTWRETGQVGIGTTSPNYPLELVSSETPLRARSTGSGIGVYTSSSSGYGVYSDATKNFMGGLTGFGQTNPTHRITVNGAIGIQESGTTRYHIDYASGGLNFVETSVADYRLFIQDGGDVGIGTGNPTERLHVDGNTRIAGTLNADNFADNTINRNDILDEVGIASVSASSAVSPGAGWTTILTKQLTVPTAGYILALGVTQIHLDHPISFESYVEVAVSDHDGVHTGGNVYTFKLKDNVSAGDYFVAIPSQRLFYVSQGDTYTFYLLASGWHATVEERNLDLLFLPTPYGSKNLADGSDAEYASADRIANRSDGVQVSKAPASSEIDKLRTELGNLQETVLRLQARLDAEGN